MRLVIVNALLVLAVCVVLFLYCCLVIAGETDEKMRRFSETDKINEDQRGR